MQPDGDVLVCFGIVIRTLSRCKDALSGFEGSGQRGHQAVLSRLRHGSVILVFICSGSWKPTGEIDIQATAWPCACTLLSLAGRSWECSSDCSSDAALMMYNYNHYNLRRNMDRHSLAYGGYSAVLSLGFKLTYTQSGTDKCMRAQKWHLMSAFHMRTRYWQNCHLKRIKPPRKFVYSFLAPWAMAALSSGQVRGAVFCLFSVGRVRTCQPSTLLSFVNLPDSCWAPLHAWLTSGRRGATPRAAKVYSKSKHDESQLFSHCRMQSCVPTLAFCWLKLQGDLVLYGFPQRPRGPDATKALCMLDACVELGHQSELFPAC